MAQIGYHRYENWNLAEKHAWMQTGAGVDGAAAAHRYLGETANGYAESDAVLKSALRGMVEWRGSAATAAAAALNKAAVWVAGAGVAGRTASGSVERYGGSFAETKPKIQAPEELSGPFEFAARAAFLGFPNAMQDRFATVEANRSKEQEANRALYGHEAATRGAVTGFPRLDPLPGVTTPPSGPQMPAGGGGGAGFSGGGTGGGFGPTVLPTAPAGGPIPTPAVSTPPLPSGAPLPSGPSATVGGGGPLPPGGLPGSGGLGGVGAAPRAADTAGRPRPGSAAGATSGVAGGRAGGASGFMGAPWAGGATGQGNEPEHRNRYAIATDDAFHPPLPVHVPPVIGED